MNSWWKPLYYWFSLAGSFNQRYFAILHLSVYYISIFHHQIAETPLLIYCFFLALSQWYIWFTRAIRLHKILLTFADIWDKLSVTGPWSLHWDSWLVSLLLVWDLHLENPLSELTRRLVNMGLSWYKDCSIGFRELSNFTKTIAELFKHNTYACKTVSLYSNDPWFF